MVYLILFLMPFFAFSEVPFDPIQIDGGKLLSYLVNAKMENHSEIYKAQSRNDHEMFMFYMGKDAVYSDLFEYFRDD